MTELMKRYESFEGKSPFIWVPEYGYMYTDSYVTWIELQNALLQSQLTWRPVSEKPEKSGYITTINTEGVISVHKFDIVSHDWDAFVYYFDITHWLPIPPM